MKKTIAVICLSGSVDIDLVCEIAAQNYPILLAGEKKVVEEIRKQITVKSKKASVEVFTCFQDCAWEADMIILFSEQMKNQDLENIRKVVTGKIILYTNAENQCTVVQQLFPLAKVVNMSNDTSNGLTYILQGEDAFALERTAYLLSEAGFNTIKTIPV